MRRVLITGASRGLGAALVGAFARRGDHVIAAVRNAEEFGNVHGVEVCALDVTSSASVQAAASRVGDVDVVINNAAVSLSGPIEAVPVEQVAALFDTNVYGPMRVIQAVTPAMRARNAGMIVNISSGTAHGSPPLQGVYAASKAALNILSGSLARELEPFGIAVITIEPPGIATGLVPSQRTYTSPAYGDPPAYQRGSSGVDPEILAERIVTALDNQPSALLTAAQLLNP